MPFHRACELISKMEKLKNREAKSLIKDENLYDTVGVSGNTLMHYAAEVGNHEMVQFLVDLNCPVDARNDLKETPLVSNLKSDFSCKKIVETLLKANASIHAQDWNGQSALYIVNSETWLRENIERFEIYKVFLENARDFRADFQLLETGTEKAIKMLLQTDIDVSATDSKGNTLIHALASNRNPGIAALLSDINFDVNSRNRDGWTPLMWAALAGSFSMVEFLLDKGANIDSEGCRYRNALCITFLRYALDEGSLKCIQLLLERGANAQIKIIATPNNTIFDLALGHERYVACELILAHLALHEQKGMNITQLIRSRIESNSRLKYFFIHCKQQLSMKIHRSVTLFDLLTVNERKLENYFREKSFTLNLEGFKTVDYYDTILRKREAKTKSTIELRSTVGPVIGKLIKIDFYSYPFVVDEIASYLGKKDMECLLSIQCEL